MVSEINHLPGDKLVPHLKSRRFLDVDCVGYDGSEAGKYV